MLGAFSAANHHLQLAPFNVYDRFKSLFDVNMTK
jgi:hypothetical protein